MRKIGGFIIIVIIICLFALYGILGCAAMILYANLDFYCIDYFIPTVANFFLCIDTYSTSLLCVAFVNFSEVLSSVCYSACFHTVSLYAFVFRTLPSCLLLLTDRRSPGVLLAHSLAGSALSTPYHRRFTNLFITMFFILLSILCFVLF